MDHLEGAKPSYVRSEDYNIRRGPAGDQGGGAMQENGPRETWVI
jgi:hypothetical protein